MTVMYVQLFQLTPPLNFGISNNNKKHLISGGKCAHRANKSVSSTNKVRKVSTNNSSPWFFRGL